MSKDIYPPMHTAEHILNQTMTRLFGTDRCFSAHIERKKSKCDYYHDHPLSEEDIRLLEEKINQIIQENLPVKEVIIDRVRAEKTFDLKNVPLDQKTVRIIQIGNYDAIPCIGPHVVTTGELGEIKIISCSHENGVLRIRYKLNDKKNANN